MTETVHIIATLWRSGSYTIDRVEGDIARSFAHGTCRTESDDGEFNINPNVLWVQAEMAYKANIVIRDIVCRVEDQLRMK